MAGTNSYEWVTFAEERGAWKGLAVEAEKATSRHIPHPTSHPGKEKRIFCRLNVLETHLARNDLALLLNPDPPRFRYLNYIFA